MTMKVIGWPLALLALAGCDKAHREACTPRRAYWHRPHNFDGLVPPMNTVSITANGALYWNDQHIPFARLREYLAQSHRLNPEPITFLQTEMGVPCDTLEQVRNAMDEQLDCRTGGHCHEGILSVWKALPTPPGTPVS